MPSWAGRRRLDDLLGEPPGNLSAQALADLVRIVRGSAHEWGLATAQQTATRLLVRIRAVADGTAIGHERRDVRPRRRTRFLVEEPWVIAYSPDTQQVFRILHGARDFPALFSPGRTGGHDAH
jgi:plasmid stabilization system protein ParE